VRDAPAVAVVMVGHDSAASLPAVLGALTPQLREGDELLVVDCGSRDGTVAVAGELGARVLDLGENRGFAGGVVAGVEATSAPLVVLLNPDAVPRPGFLDTLRAVALSHPSWGAWQGLITMHDGREVNTDGNFVHWLGFGWAGSLGEPSAPSRARAPHEVGFPSGAAMAVRREAWDAIGGFEPGYFMYGEDLDLGLRLRLAGWQVGIAPGAEVIHDYDFTKGDYKWFWLERNRWWTLLATYPAPLLVAIAPALVGFELALLFYAWRTGWLGAKLRAQAAVLRELPGILRRRRAVQATARLSTRAFAHGLTAALDSPHLQAAHTVPGAAAAQAAYWRLVRLVVR
jgi:N-acetylglucosaminyl-diphospho-decaprenol L-rhamnosyltransferase